MRRMVVVVSVALVLSMLSPVLSLAEQNPLAMARALDNDTVGVGYLPGNTSGSYAYFRFPYPGDQTPVTVTVSFLPGDRFYRTAFGFRVYGWNGYLLGEGTSISQPGTKQVTIRDPLAVDALIVIYNYHFKAGAQYRVSVSGLPEETPTLTALAAPTPRATPTPTPAAAAGSGSSEDPHILEKGVVVEGRLVGNRGGTFAYAQVSAEAGDAVSLDLRAMPFDLSAGDAVGMTIYGPRGAVAKGARSSTPGQRAAAFTAKASGTYLVQIYNYAAGRTMEYRLILAE